MQLENSFTVAVPVHEAWAALLDVERIAPCMPGATLDGVDGDEFRGRVKVKLGPITMTYSGVARFVEKNASEHVALIEATGKETRGNGTAQATVHTKLVEQGDSTEVTVTTDLAITGKPAQFGRGVMLDVSGKLMAEFAARLAQEVGTDSKAASNETDPAPLIVADSASPVAPQTGGGAPRPPLASAEPIDLLATAGFPVAKRLLPAVAAIALLLFMLSRRRR